MANQELLQVVTDSIQAGMKLEEVSSYVIEKGIRLDETEMFNNEQIKANEVMIESELVTTI